MFETRSLRYVPTRWAAALLIAAAATAPVVTANPQNAFADEEVQAIESVESPEEETTSSDETAHPGELVFSQDDIDSVGKQTRGGQCLCYSYAYAMTIITGEVHEWSEYSVGGGVTCQWLPELTDMLTCPTEEETLRTVYDGLQEGHPVIIHLRMSGGGQHWVCVTGYTGTDLENMTLSDFQALDSVNGIADEGPDNIDEDLYCLYLSENNVRVATSSTAFLTDEAKAQAEAAAQAEATRAEVQAQVAAKNQDQSEEGTMLPIYTASSLFGLFT